MNLDLMYFKQEDGAKNPRKKRSREAPKIGTSIVHYAQSKKKSNLNFF